MTSTLQKCLRIAICGGLALLLLSASACAGPKIASNAAASIADMEPVTLTVSFYVSESSGQVQAFKAFAKEVENETNGKISFETYYSAALTPSDEMVSALQSGTVDLGPVTTVLFPQELPASYWMLKMGSMPSDRFPVGFLSAAAATHEAFTEFDALENEFTERGLKVLFANVPVQQYELLCTKPIGSLAEAQGVRTRSAGGIWTDETKALGMTPVATETREQYQALQRGVIDCLVAPISAMIDSGYWNIAKHYIPVHMSTFLGNTVAISLDTWKALPPDAKTIIQRAAQTYWREGVVNALSRYVEFAKNYQSKNIVIHDPGTFNDRLTRQQRSAIDSLAQSAPASVERPQDFIDSYRGSLNRWEQVVAESSTFGSVSVNDTDGLIDGYSGMDSAAVTRLVDRLATELFNA